MLALRVGLLGAQALSPLATAPIRVKWPNDLYVDDGKLAGILIETRWRGTASEWVAIGMGVNVMAPDVAAARGLRPGTNRVEALCRLVPALRAAASAAGHLSVAERDAWAERDYAAGRSASEPAAGVVRGISASGELLIEEADGAVRGYRSGSLTFAPLACS